MVSGAGSAAQSLWDASGQLVQPTLRLGVTGLARSGKTVFTTALVHHLTRGTPLPAFRAAAEGRIRRARLAHQPDDEVARFPYEEHAETMIEARRWPQSTTRISEMRVEVEYERAAGWRSGPATLTLDIVDYPGEWLLDLALDVDGPGAGLEILGVASGIALVQPELIEVVVGGHVLERRQLLIDGVRTA